MCESLHQYMLLYWYTLNIVNSQLGGKKIIFYSIAQKE